MVNHIRLNFAVFVALVLTFGCQSTDDRELPFLGNHQEIDGQIVYHTIPSFSFINQDSLVVTNDLFKGKWYIADFFFTSCPTICPKVKKQMMRIYDHFKNEDRLLLLSHSIDTRRDSVPVLKKYADKLKVSADKWHFVTGDKEKILSMAPEYMSLAFEDENAPGGYDHSGYIVLIDPNGHIRGYCDGTDPKSVDSFIKTIERALRSP